ncbi:S26 family signal peptidase [Spirillospora sp. NPDC050679]
MRIRWQAGFVAALVLAVPAAALVVRRRYAVIMVRGDSMLPAYGPGDRVLVRRTGLDGVRRGQAVVFTDSFADTANDVRGPAPDLPLRMPDRLRDGWLIKRVAALPGDRLPPAVPPVFERRTIDAVVPDGCWVALGDNPHASFDSRYYGCLAAERIVGVVLRPIPQ